MIYKGIVMEVNRNYCIVLTNTQEFIKLKMKKNIYESQEIYFTESDIYSQRSYAKWAFAAAIVLIGLFLSGIQINQLYPYMNPYNAAVVSIDINPSIEFYIDEKNMVTKVIPLNEEANFLVCDNWKGLTFHVVLNEYFDNAIEKEYLKQESTILMSCAALDDDFNKDVIIKQVNKTIQEKNVSDITYGYIESNKESVKKAQKANVSIGKFEIYNDVKDSHQDMDTIEEVKNTEVSQLIEETEIVQVINKQDNKREKDNHEERYENHEEGFEDNHFNKDAKKGTYFNKNIKQLEHDKIKKERFKKKLYEKIKNLKKNKQQKVDYDDIENMDTRLNQDDEDDEDDEIDDEKKSNKRKEKNSKKHNKNYDNDRNDDEDRDEKGKDDEDDDEKDDDDENDDDDDDDDEDDDEKDD